MLKPGNGLGDPPRHLLGTRQLDQNIRIARFDKPSFTIMLFRFFELTNILEHVGQLHADIVPRRIEFDRFLVKDGRISRSLGVTAQICLTNQIGRRVGLAAGMRGGPTGDLYIFLSVAPHPIFQRDGANILCRVPIPMTTAALGGAIEVPTIDGQRARVAIPAGASSGQQFRLKGKGMSVLRSGARGDMFVQAFVETPQNLTPRQQELLDEFAKAATAERMSPQSASFFGKVKELWNDLKD